MAKFARSRWLLIPAAMGLAIALVVALRAPGNSLNWLAVALWVVLLITMAMRRRRQPPPPRRTPPGSRGPGGGKRRRR